MATSTSPATPAKPSAKNTAAPARKGAAKRQDELVGRNGPGATHAAKSGGPLGKSTSKAALSQTDAGVTGTAKAAGARGVTAAVEKLAKSIAKAASGAVAKSAPKAPRGHAPAAAAPAQKTSRTAPAKAAATAKAAASAAKAPAGRKGGAPTKAAPRTAKAVKAAEPAAATPAAASRAGKGKPPVAPVRAAKAAPGAKAAPPAKRPAAPVEGGKAPSAKKPPAPKPAERGKVAPPAKPAKAAAGAKAAPPAKKPPAPKPAEAAKAPAAKRPPAPTGARTTKAAPVAVHHHAASSRTGSGLLSLRKREVPARRTEGYVEERFLNHQRHALDVERATYLEQAKSLRAEAELLVEEMEPGDIQFDDESGEGGTVTVDRERDLALSAQALVAVDEIDHALAKMATHTYGICENCGRLIPKARLEALPYARLCIDCKSGGLSRR